VVDLDPKVVTSIWMSHGTVSLEWLPSSRVLWPCNCFQVVGIDAFFIEAQVVYDQLGINVATSDDVHYPVSMNHGLREARLILDEYLNISIARDLPSNGPAATCIGSIYTSR
jgi:hypothetical protein